MTDEQWSRIAAWISQQLKKKRIRAITPEDLAIRFLLKKPFWPQLQERVAAEACGFTVHRPNDKIEFRRVK
jgi:hypothetical protein